MTDTLQVEEFLGRVQRVDESVSDACRHRGCDGPEADTEARQLGGGDGAAGQLPLRHS